MLMKNLLIAVLAATTAVAGVAPAGVAAAQPGYHQDRDQGRDYGRDHGQDHGQDHGRDRRGPPDHWDQDARRWRDTHHYRYYGGNYGYTGYHGRWRTGQRYTNWRDNRYVIQDYRVYNLPPPRPGYRYYRESNGDVVMAAITSGVIGLIIGGALAN
jgi:Ni/Co efflux regulator RcnB